jgi:hypothetical protein
MVRLTAERAEMIWSLTSFSDEALTQAPVFDSYTAKDLLAHVADWDDFHTERIRLAQVGKAAEMVSIGLDERNAALYEQRKGWSLFEAVEACLAARRRFEETTAPLSDSVFHQPVTFPSGAMSSIRSWSQWRYQHDGAHTADFAAWRERNKAARTTAQGSVDA